MTHINISTIGKLDNKNGVNTFILNLVKNKDLFLKNKIILDGIYINGKIVDLEKVNILKQSTKKKNLNEIIIKKLKYFKNNTFIGNLLGYILFIKNASSLNLTSDCVVFFQDIFSCFYYKKKENQKIVMTIHSGDDPMIQYLYTFPYFRGTFMEKYLKYVLKKSIIKADKVVVLSNSFRKKLIKEGYTNITTIYNGVEKSLIKKKKYIYNPTAKIKIIVVASMIHRKGIDLLIEAFNKLSSEEKTKLDFTLVGGGNSMAKYQQMVIDYKCTPHIHFLGLRSDVKELLLEHDLFLLPSRDEGLPIALLEAMSVGLPVCLTNVGSIPESLDKNSYYAMEPQSEDILLLLKKLVKNEVDLNAMRKSADTIFENIFLIDSMINKYCALLD
ncbi:MAG: glycosyltransferase family 4 protein [Candidatus Gracilibacteria bacterium]